MIVLDVEATGLIQSGVTPLPYQPHMFEVAAVKLTDGTWTVADVYHQMVRPPVAIPEKVQKLTGVTDAMVKDAPRFVECYPAFTRFMVGESYLVAHNLMYDVGVLACELRRIGMEYRFPWPPTHLCSIEATAPYVGRYLDLGELYQMVVKRPLNGAHRARADAEALAVVVKRLSHKAPFDRLQGKPVVAFQR